MICLYFAIICCICKIFLNKELFSFYNFVIRMFSKLFSCSSWLGLVSISGEIFFEELYGWGGSLTELVVSFGRKFCNVEAFTPLLIGFGGWMFELECFLSGILMVSSSFLTPLWDLYLYFLLEDRLIVLRLFLSSVFKGSFKVFESSEFYGLFKSFKIVWSFDSLWSNKCSLRIFLRKRVILIKSLSFFFLNI